MLKVIEKLLEEKLNDIKAGNSNADEEELFKIVNCINDVTNNTKMYTRTEAAKYLQCSVQTFDNYRSSGKLEKGIKKAGRLEEWSKKQLDDLIRRERNGH